MRCRGQTLADGSVSWLMLVSDEPARSHTGVSRLWRGEAGRLVWFDELRLRKGGEERGGGLSGDTPDAKTAPRSCSLTAGTRARSAIPGADLLIIIRP